GPVVALTTTGLAGQVMVGATPTWMVTWAKESAQGGFAIVHRKTSGPAPPVCVKVELPACRSLNVPVPPLWIVQVPVPEDGELPPRLAVVPPGTMVCGPPAVAVCGGTLVTVVAAEAALLQPLAVTPTV